MSRRAAGWVPNQHGAWAMLAVPFIAGMARGIADGTFQLVVVPLLGLWFVGYFAFFAAGLWLKSRRRPRYLPALRTYAAICVVLAAAVLVLDWHLTVWAPFFVPFLSIGLWAAARRTERSVLSGFVMVAAASLISLVVYTACRTGGSVWHALLHAQSPILPLAALLFAYLFGTVLYVKAMIRRRGVQAYARASVGYHLAITALSVPMAVFRDATWWWAVAFLAATATRAWVLSGRKLTPKALGLGEVVASVALLAVAVVVR